MPITMRLLLVLAALLWLVWLPRAEAQIPRPKPPAPRPKPRPAPTPAPTPAVDQAVWNTIKNTADPVVLETFLNDYPNSRFAAAARARLAELRRPKATPTPRPTAPPVVPSPVRSFEFETVRLNRYGGEVERTKLQARYFVEDLGNGVRLEMVEIPGGRFQMGSPTSEAERYNDEGPQHTVNVASFWIGKFEVTQAQWQAVMGSNPANFKGDGNLPVEQVSWNDVQEFLKKLNGHPNLQGRNYRLPSEAEWEYAARAGTTTPFAFGDTITPQIVNYNGVPYANAAKGLSRGKTVPVGSLGVANAFGLFDMHGNVWEWCQDVWHSDYSSAPSDGSSWLSGGDSSSRVLRGGSWGSDGWVCRAADRGRNAPGLIIYSVGFRLVSARTS